MIQLTVSRENDRIKQIELSGHAESGPYGYDIVCAGVSSVAFGTINAVEKLLGIELQVQQGYSGGYLTISVPFIKHRQRARQVQLLLESMLVSMETIEQDYSQSITITQKQGG